jgi:hypothetical protein
MAEEMMYIPQFRDELFESGLNLYVANEGYLKKNWLTPGIVEEIEKQFPIGSEIDATDRNQRDYEGYLWKIAILFPVGR